MMFSDCNWISKCIYFVRWCCKDFVVVVVSVFIIGYYCVVNKYVIVFDMCEVMGDVGVESYWGFVNIWWVEELVFL